MFYLNCKFNNDKQGVYKMSITNNFDNSARGKKVSAGTGSGVFKVFSADKPSVSSTRKIGQP